MNLKDQIKAAEKAIVESDNAVARIKCPKYGRVVAGFCIRENARCRLRQARQELALLKNHLKIK